MSAKQQNTSESTRSHFCGEHLGRYLSVSAHAGRHTALTAAQEDELAECIMLMARWGWGFSADEVKDIVQEFVKARGISTRFVDSRPCPAYVRCSCSERGLYFPETRKRQRQRQR